MYIKNVFVLKALVFSLLLTPSLSFFPSFPAIRIDDVLIFCWLFAVFLLLPFKFIFFYKTRLLFIFILMLYMIFPFLNGVLNGYEGSFADFNQYIRFGKYIGVYFLASLVFYNASDKQVYNFLTFTLKCGAVLVIIALSQYINPFGINEKYVQLIAPTQYRTLIGGYLNPRPIGMIGNPNELGFLMVLLTLLCFYVAYRYKSMRSYLYLVLFFLGIVITLSRSSLVAYFVGVATFFSWVVLKSGVIAKIKVFIYVLFFLSILSITLMQPQVYERFTWRFAKLTDLSTDASTNVRFENWSENLDIIKAHPVIGVGPLRRAHFEHPADNEWLLIWRSYGIVGIILILGFYLRGVFSRKALEYKALHLSIVTSSFVYMIPVASFYSLVIFPVVLILLAMIDQSDNVD